MEERDEGRNSDLAVMDASEYKQKRRLRRILDAHDEVEDISTAAYGQFAASNISREGLNIRILKAVQKYIREAHGLIMEYRQEHGVEMGQSDGFWIREQPIGKLDFHSQEPLMFHGLKDILYAREMYQEQWDEVVSTRHGPDQTVTRQASHTVPEQVSLEGYLLLNQFLSTERDIVGINFEDEGLSNFGPEEVSIIEEDGEVKVL